MLVLVLEQELVLVLVQELEQELEQELVAGLAGLSRLDNNVLRHLTTNQVSEDVRLPHPRQERKRMPPESRARLCLPVVH